MYDPVENQGVLVLIKSLFVNVSSISLSLQKSIAIQISENGNFGARIPPTKFLGLVTPTEIHGPRNPCLETHRKVALVTSIQF